MALNDIYQAVLNLKKDQVAELVKAELAAGTAVGSILSEGLIAAMDEVGRRFSAGETFVPEMLLAAQAMKCGMDILRPVLLSAGSKVQGTVVIGTVKGDLHDIGKNLVAIMLEGAGFKVVDLGVDVEADGFISAARENRAGLVALSALLTTTMPAMRDSVASLKNQGVNARVMVGGAPVTQEFAKKIGADGYAADAPSAVTLARKLVGV